MKALVKGAKRERHVRTLASLERQRELPIV